MNFGKSDFTCKKYVNTDNFFTSLRLDFEFNSSLEFALKIQVCAFKRRNETE